MIESQSADRSAGLDCGTVRISAYFFFSPQASLDRLGNGRSPFRRHEAKQTCGVPALQAGGSVR